MVSISGSTILVTGGTGSFGRKFIETILPLNPNVVRVISRDELKQSEMEAQFQDSRLRFFVGDIRDIDRLHDAMRGVDIVIHGAALKRIEKCEYDPDEAVKTNIGGTANVIKAARWAGVKRVVGLSTDKAVQAATLYGMTKAVAERLLIQANVLGGCFSVVRYGNVMGSRGSVIPIFKRQRDAGEPLTITDPDMTRFWISLDQAVALVLRAIETMHGGEIFVPKLPSMKMSDLAFAIAPKASWKIVGMRAAEKAHEILITEEESRHAVECADYYVIMPEFPFWTETKPVYGTPLNHGFVYTSNNNAKWLTTSDLARLTE